MTDSSFVQQYLLVVAPPWSTPSEAELAAAWERLNDCGCADVYYCMASRDIECPRHSGFVTCCDRAGEHVPVR